MRLLLGFAAGLLVVGALAASARTTGGPSSSPPSSPGSEAKAPAFTLADWPTNEVVLRGKLVYEQNCVGCHGTEGKGDGPAARHLDPLPRNFQKGFFKFRTTASGQLPTEADLLRTVTCGLPGSSMPAFPLLSETKRRAVVAYVFWLTTFGRAKTEVEVLQQAENLSLDEIKKTKLGEIRKTIQAEIDRAQPLAVPPEPEASAESIARGKTRYEKECASCHGKTGVGDGPSSFTLRDWQDAQILPRDFTTGVFRAGSTPRDLFIRLKGGLNGTPMPSIQGSDDDLWALVHYIMTLVRQDRRPTGGHLGCDTVGKEEGR